MPASAATIMVCDQRKMSQSTKITGIGMPISHSSNPLPIAHPLIFVEATTFGDRRRSGAVSRFTVRSGDGAKSELAAFPPMRPLRGGIKNEVAKMNFKGLPSQVRSLVETLNEAASDEKYEIVDVEEDGDTVTVTFSREPGIDEDATEGDDDDDR